VSEVLSTIKKSLITEGIQFPAISSNGLTSSLPWQSSNYMHTLKKNFLVTHDNLAKQHSNKFTVCFLISWAAVW